MRRLFLILGVVLLLLMVVGVAYAQEPGDETAVVLPTLVTDLLIGGVAPGVFIMAVVQIAKHFGLKDGWAGRIVLILSVLFLAVGVLAEFYQIESEVGGLLGILTNIAHGILVLVTMNVTGVESYKYLKKMEVIKPIKRPK